MSTVSADPARSARRAHIVAEAVISAYIHEIAQPAPRAARVRVDDGGIEPMTALARPAIVAGGYRGPFAPPPRWDEQDLAA